jgi:predicted transcriptional regulator
VISITTINSAAMRDEQKSMNDRLTAFRLPDYLLRRVDDFCDRYDFTRSQFFRRSIVEFIDRHGVEVEAVNAGNATQ